MTGRMEDQAAHITDYLIDMCGAGAAHPTLAMCWRRAARRAAWGGAPTTVRAHPARAPRAGRPPPGGPSGGGGGEGGGEGGC